MRSRTSSASLKTPHEPSETLIVDNPQDTGPTIAGTFIRGTLSVFALSCFGALGCAPATTQAPVADRAGHSDHADHDHADHDHEHPETLAAGVMDLEEICGNVKALLDAGDQEKADDQVHLVGHTLEDIQALAISAKLPTDALAAVTKAADEIFDCFDKLDTALHAPEGKAVEYAPYAERIEAAIQILKAQGSN